MIAFFMLVCVFHTLYWAPEDRFWDIEKLCRSIASLVLADEMWPQIVIHSLGIRARRRLASLQLAIKITFELKPLTKGSVSRCFTTEPSSKERANHRKNGDIGSIEGILKVIYWIFSKWRPEVKRFTQHLNFLASSAMMVWTVGEIKILSNHKVNYDN